MDIKDIQSKIEKQLSILNNQPYGLFSGTSGIILYYCNLFINTNDKNYLNKVESLLEIVYDKIYSDSTLDYSYCTGLSGLGCLIDYIDRNKLINFHIDELHEVDDVLTNILVNNFNRMNLDFLHGHIGIVFYLLKRSEKKSEIRKTLQLFINALYNLIEWNNKTEIKWRFYDNITSKVDYNISLSHGMSAIVMLLLKMKTNKIECENLDSLINYSMNYILSQQINANEYGSYFSYLAMESELVIRKSRLAWCYGDLGIAITLWNAGVIMNNIDWTNKSQEILLFSALNRRELSQNMVFDAGLCHGTSGIALIFYRMFLNTKIAEFKNATEYWIDQTFKMAKFRNGLAGYKTYNLKSNSWINDYSFLEGITGIGLLLNSFQNQTEPTWDEFLLLS